jgi:phosphoribosyl-AMP cyclohydrolase
MNFTLERAIGVSLGGRLTFLPGPSKRQGMKELLDQLRFDANGLIPIIVQDQANGQILMMAWMNRTAIEKTLETGKIHTYSRSRGRLALKGESSRHFQHVKEVLTDCDRDVLLFKCVQDVAACHEGYRSCFFRQLDLPGKQWKIIAQKVFDPDAVYEKK